MFSITYLLYQKRQRSRQYVSRRPVELFFVALSFCLILCIVLKISHISNPLEQIRTLSPTAKVLILDTCFQQKYHFFRIVLFSLISIDLRCSRHTSGRAYYQDISGCSLPYLLVSPASAAVVLFSHYLAFHPKTAKATVLPLDIQAYKKITS